MPSRDPDVQALLVAQVVLVRQEVLWPWAVSSNPQHETLNPEPSTLNPTPQTLNPEPSSFNPKPRTPETEIMATSEFHLRVPGANGSQQGAVLLQEVQEHLHTGAGFGV